MCRRQLLKPKIAVSHRFHLKPLAAVLDGEQRVCVLLADRTKARIFEMRKKTIVEKQDFINELTRRGKSDGYGGYDAGHAERKQIATKPRSTSRPWPSTSSSTLNGVPATAC